MRDAYRQRTVDLMRCLLEAPQKFDFYQAVRILQRMLGEPDKRDGSGRIRFRNSIALSYPSGDIEAIRVLRDGQPIEPIDSALKALSDTNVEVEVTPSFFGLLGNFGTLPLHYTEWLTAAGSPRQQARARAFLDLMSFRQMQQYYAAWRYRNPALGFEGSDTHAMAVALKSLAGRGMEEGGNDGSDPLLHLSDEQVACVCAALRQRPMSAPYLGKILSACVGDIVEVADFVGSWYTLPPELHCRLGEANHTLGVNAIIGKHLWQAHLRISLRVGPLQKERFEDFLPEGKSTAILRRWLLALVGNAYEYEIVPILHRDDVGRIRLGRKSRLGRDAFLSTGPSAEHRSDARYLLTL